jgi:hypothetical protein
MSKQNTYLNMEHSVYWDPNKMQIIQWKSTGWGTIVDKQNNINQERLSFVIQHFKAAFQMWENKVLLERQFKLLSLCITKQKHI